MQQLFSEQKLSHNLAQWIAVFLLLVGYFFAVMGVSYYVIRRDEHTTIGHIGGLDDNGMSLAETIESLQETSTQHPPLYFLIANIWGQLTSYHVFSLRFLSVLLGMLSLAFVYRLASDLGGKLVAVYALLIMITLAIFIFYVHDMRQYMVLTFCVSLMFMMYHRLAYSTPPLKIAHLTILMLSALGAIYTHYSAMFALVPIGAYHLLFAPKNRGWWKISGAMILAGVLFLPWVPVVIDGALDIASEAQTGEVTVFTNVEIAERAMLYWGNGERLLFIAIMGLSLLATLFNPRGSRYALFFVIVMAITVGVMNEYLEFVEWMRYMLVFSIPFSIFAGYGFSLLHRWRILLPIIPIFFVIWIITGTTFQSTKEYLDETQTFIPKEYFLEFNELLPLINEVVNPDDSILITVVFHYGMTRDSKQGKMSIEDYYFANIDIPYANLYSGRLARDPFNADELTETIKPYTSIWLTYPIRDMFHIREFIKAIKDDYTACQTINYGERSVLEQYIANDQFEALCPVD